MTTPEISVVVPVYNEVDSIEPYLAAVTPILDAVADSWEIIFAADPCTDGTEDMLRGCAQRDGRIKALLFTRRFGQPLATLAGIDAAGGDAVIVMDVDLQDPPEVITEMVKRWRAGAPLVLGQRVTRTGDSRVKKVVAKLGYAFLNRYAEVPIPKNTGDFRLLDRKVVEQLKLFPETNGFLRGLVALVGYEPEVVYFDRPARAQGKTKYHGLSLRIGFNGIVGFSTVLLKVSTYLGFFAALTAVVAAIAYAIAQIRSAPFPLGNPTIVIIVLLVGGAILMCLGILGLYIGRIYDEVKRRPRYIVRESINL